MAGPPNALMATMPSVPRARPTALLMSRYIVTCTTASLGTGCWLFPVGVDWYVTGEAMISRWWVSLMKTCVGPDVLDSALERDTASAADEKMGSTGAALWYSGTGSTLVASACKHCLCLHE